jgi:hypothetical protein
MSETKGQNKERQTPNTVSKQTPSFDFVLDKIIFSNVFQKDIRHVYTFRKIERLAKAIYLILPAFDSRSALRVRLESVSVNLIDASVRTPTEAGDIIGRELLTLTSLLSVARSTGILSPMNADLITNESILLLNEVAAYQQPRLFVEESPSLAELSKHAPDLRDLSIPAFAPRSTYDFIEDFVPAPRAQSAKSPRTPKGQIKDKAPLSGRQESILDVLRSKGPSYIKDISTIVREVSEKTIQRELQTLIQNGKVIREGERRWTRYTVIG